MGAVQAAVSETSEPWAERRYAFLEVCVPVERCPKCGGPVEVKRELYPHDRNSKVRRVALPDTLEGIEAEAGTRVVARLHEAKIGCNSFVYTSGYNQSMLAGIAFGFHQALTRLFQGCAECGRLPRHDMIEGTKQIEHIIKRQAFQQAAGEVRESSNILPQLSPDGKLGWIMAHDHLEAKLRQLAEDA